MMNKERNDEINMKAESIKIFERINMTGRESNKWRSVIKKNYAEWKHGKKNHGTKVERKNWSNTFLKNTFVLIWI